MADITMTLGITNLASGLSPQIRIYDITSSAEDVAWTNTGVTERTVGLSKSAYYYSATLNEGHSYQIDWRDAASPTIVATEFIYEYQTQFPIAASVIADTVWDEPILGHTGAGTTGNALNAAGSAGDPWSTPLPGSYEAGTAGSIVGTALNPTIGSNLVTVTVLDSDNDNPLPNTFVSIWNEGLTYVYDGKYANQDGEVLFSVNIGTYNLICNKDGYSFTIPEEVVVLESTEKEVLGTAISIPVPLVSSVCRVYDYMMAPDDNTPATTISSTIEILKLPYDYNGKLHSGYKITPTYNSSTGLIYWDIVYGAIVKVHIPNYVPSTTIVIPSLPTKRLADLL